jgi:uncharacterized protein
MFHWSRRLPTATAATVAAAALVGLAAGTASAHVTVNPRQAAQGGFAAFAFRVPNEREDASTVKLDVAFPADQPIAYVSVRPHPGWSYQVNRTKLAQPIKGEEGEISEVVSAITWTADSATTAIKPGEYDEFSISAGPLPEQGDSLVFKANQTYSNGEVVRWIEQPPAGSTEEPEHPAPSVALTPASDTEAQAQPTAAAAEDSTAESTDAWAYTALGVGLLAVALAVVALWLALSLRRRRAQPAPAASAQDEAHERTP